MRVYYRPNIKVRMAIALKKINLKLDGPYGPSGHERVKLMYNEKPITHFFFYKNLFYKNHSGSDLVQNFTENGEELIY